MSQIHFEGRDDAPRRVMFHPSVCASGSGEDLAFDPTKVFTPAHRRESDDYDGILSNANAPVSPRRKNLKTHEVYNGMSRRCRADLVRVDKDSRVNTILKKHREQSENPNPASTPARTPLDPSKMQPFAAEEREGPESEETNTGPMSPKQFSVNKIQAARAGPVPKTDDFFAELKQWHDNYALRQVEKPGEIMVTTMGNDGEQPTEETKDTRGKEKKGKFWKRKSNVDAPGVSATPDVEKTVKRASKKELKEAKKLEQEKKSLAKKEAIKAAAEAKKLEQEKKALAKKEAIKAAADAKKAKKEEKAKKKQSKREAKKSQSNISVSSVAESLKVKSAEGESERKETTKVGPSVSFTDKLGKMFQHQVDMREEQNATESSPSESKEGAETVETREGVSSEVLVETVEEESSVEDETETPKPKLEPEATADSTTTPVEDAPADAVEETGELQQTESWLEKAAGFFKKDEASPTEVDENKEATDAEVAEKAQSPEPADEAEEIAEPAEEIVEPAEEGQQQDEPQVEDRWFGKLTGFFNKEERMEPPVLVVEVDKYEMDKYEAFAEAEEAEKDAAEKGNEEEEKPVVESNDVAPEAEKQNVGFCPCVVGQSDKYTAHAEDEALITEQATRDTDIPLDFTYSQPPGMDSGFTQADCPCMIGQQQHDEAEIEAGESGYDLEAETDIEPADSEYEMEEKSEFKMGESENEVETQEPQKESTWFGMFFTPREQTEAQAEDAENKEETATERGSTQTPQASNGKRRGYFCGGEKELEQVESMRAGQPETLLGGLPGSVDVDEVGTAEDSLLTDPEVKPFGEEKDMIVRSFDFITKEQYEAGVTSFDNSLLTQEEGTKVSKIEPTSPSMRSLLDLDATKSESQSCDDETPKQGSDTESPPCADSKDPELNASEGEPSEKIEEKAHTSIAFKSKNKEEAKKGKQKQSKAKKSKKKKQPEVGGTLFGRLEPVSHKKKKKPRNAGTLF